MSSAIILDTLAYANKLKQAGVPEKQAEVQVEMLAEIIGDRLATKQDLELKLAELKNDLIRWMLGSFIAQTAIIISASS